MSAPPGAENPVGVHRTRIEWIDTDAAGIYHNSTVVRFVEAAEASLMAGLGLHGYFPVAPRVRYEVDFDAPLFFGQDVCTVVEPVRVGTSSMTFAFEVWGEEFRGRPRGRAAHGRYVTVHVGGDHREGAASAPWPAEWVAALTRPVRPSDARPAYSLE
ncbi:MULTISPECIES: acyl-CoA thioesterase [Streptomyces]|uniref:Acyl-CoA thioester hydrolase n=1 Tax=Streptomyces stelliscabiei TaxID=146820 RepID=A0A8I0P385_9ACTN|nr:MULTISPECIES: hotdog domain-containing protein [Streptomyces]MBE1594573.1 acyl-CoA thioester hydrolase [Streptomyces stelliscabiei]MDX2521055.1 hotdog domain-containing protein [Streptomyces stelliscabiei]MDX2550723.1 hotdog domain-containing protein [Streptomyces stelliscabiei]MDX2616894.1 hotdog domain-containing protein [Streptomyces stelliscabiei]MDX2635890.1 hotdog domain-containing protein [Streptomyces stelliscabiei]